MHHMTLCGIPRVRVLGTKKDWVELEGKVDQWITQVFGGCSSKMVEYLQKAKGMIHDIHTRRDESFWKRMFSINRCHSGHTDVVEGWIVRMYRKGHSRKHQGELLWSGDDFYNYDSHISTLTYKNIDTEKTYSLHSGTHQPKIYPTYRTPRAQLFFFLKGLLYSRIEASGQDELDKKYPFLVPHFAHMVRDVTPGNMSDTDYDYYLQNLGNSDRKLLQKFRWAMPPGNLLVLGGDSEKITQKQQLILDGFTTWLERAKAGDADTLSKFKTFRLKRSLCDGLGWDYSFSSEKEEGEGKSITEKQEELKKEHPILTKVVNTIVEILRLGVTETFTIEYEYTMLNRFLFIILEGLAGNTALHEIRLQKITAEDESLLADFLSSPQCALKVR